ncbi:MAG: TatD family hydrolase [Candidatus Heimdallarchaeota archaeon]|nr:MAG: TatD family hydrolase [Candidatus Heimdallarchaeota archaeon]
MIDSHAHILPDFVKNIDKIIENARGFGLDAVINSAIEPHHYEYASYLEKKHPRFVYTTLGFSASHIQKIDFDLAYRKIRKYPSLVAIGEVGLDYHWIKDSYWRKQEQKVFLEFIKLANEREKPLVIHSRKAEKECLDILEKNAKVPVLMHCFAGTLEEAWKIMNLGWFISIPTAVRNRKKHRRIARNIPLEHIVVETDTPFLSPWPGKQNEPANIKYAIEEIAILKETTFKEVDNVTTRNAQEFYGIG